MDIKTAGAKQSNTKKSNLKEERWDDFGGGAEKDEESKEDVKAEKNAFEQALAGEDLDQMCKQGLSFEDYNLY